MKKLFILGMVLLSVSAFAGNEKGNGGGIHYCKADATQELYDIYEAQARYGHTLDQKPLSFDGYLNRALAKIKKNSPYIGRMVEAQINYLKDNHIILRARVKLAPIADANILLVDEGCSYEQLANWDEVSGNLIVNKDYFDKMNSLNKAAFYIHETLYKVGRDLRLLTKDSNGVITSDEVRRMVGEIFSTKETLEQIWTTVDPQIAIDESHAKGAVVKNQINEMMKECSEGVSSYHEAREQLNSSNIETYIVTYFNSMKACNSADINIESSLRSLAYDNLTYSFIGEFLQDSHKEIHEELSELKRLHEKTMSGPLFTKN